jgi:serine/threonine protein phosphatase PrpC
MAETFYGITDTGRMRDNNEDAFIAEPVLDDRYIAACVIDGVGGYEGGEVAAAIAKESIRSYFTVPSGAPPVMMQEAVLSANNKIYNEKTSNEKYSSMACVLTFALIDKEGNKFYYAHVGDTRLYLLRDGSLVKVTRDHSFVGFLEDSGRLNETEAMTHMKRNEIDKALGFDATIPNPAEYIETGESPFLPGDLILLCSDGLTDLVNRQGITAILTQKGSLAERAKALINAANDAGGKDNITVVLVHNVAKPVKLKASRPAIKVKKNIPPVSQPVSTPPPPRPTAAPAPVRTPKKKTSALLPIFVLISILSTGALLWLLLSGNKKEPAGPLGVTTPAPGTDMGALLQETITTFTGDTLVIDKAVFGARVSLRDTLVIDRDFLYIKGGGLTIANDSANGNTSVILLRPNLSQVVFDSISFVNTSILLAPEDKGALNFRNAGFQNSYIQALQRFTAPDSLYTGSVKGLVLITDTL